MQGAVSPAHFECGWPPFGSKCLRVSRNAACGQELSGSIAAAACVPESGLHAAPPGKWEEAERLALRVCWTCCQQAWQMGS